MGGWGGGGCKSDYKDCFRSQKVADNLILLIIISFPKFDLKAGYCYHGYDYQPFSNLSMIRWQRSHLQYITVYYQEQITSYCYHSVNVISFSLAQSDHIKGLYSILIVFYK